ncbi:MAG: PilW family protein [Nitrosomonadales bacterium]|nr:PilW family protein [Nitrosomonadales bacterium]
MMSTARKPEHSFFPRRQAGLSLAELMISLTIGLVLLAGITTLIVQQSGTRREMEKSSRQIENGRYAMEILRNDIELAGFFGEYAPLGNATYSAPDPCIIDEANLGWDAASSPVAVPVAIQGYAAADAAPLCVANRLAGTAMLVVRRTGSATVDATASGVVGTTYFQTARCNTDTAPFVLNKLEMLSDFPLQLKDCVTRAPLYTYIVRIYYISACSVETAGACEDTIPTLKVVEFMNGGLTTIPLVEGIENLQFDYGIDTTNDGAPDSYKAAPAANEWVNVMAVRVSLLARNNEPTAGYTDSKTYNFTLDGAASAVAPGGAFKRHMYSQLVRAVNPSGRRE